MAAVLRMTGLEQRGQMLFDEPMAKHTSWRTGGAARQYYVAKDIDDLAMMLKSLPANEAVFWLGLGSNTLVRDGGFAGTVIAMQGVSTELILEKDGHIVVGASVSCAKLAKYCAKNKLKGAEFFAGIPGLVGGALAMNAGAFGGVTWRHVINVQTISRRGLVKTRQANEFDVSYRSVTGLEDEWFISATLEFEVADDGEQTKAIKALLAERAKTQPTGVFSCGSVFKNPKGHFAAELIERCGLKGERIGGAVISQKHANFILNDADATAEDIESLILMIQKRVTEKTSVDLFTEVKIIGEHR